MNFHMRHILFLLLLVGQVNAAQTQIVYWWDNGSKPCPSLTSTPDTVTFIIRGGTGAVADYSFQIEKIKRLDNIPVIGMQAQSGAAPAEPTFTATMDDSADWLIRVAQAGPAQSNGLRPILRKRTWKCGEDTSLILSAGGLFTQLQNRTYRSVRLPGDTGPGTNVLSVQGGSSSYTPLGTALFNFKLPIRSLPHWTGLAISSGPVFRFGGSPEVSSFGYFAGISAHIWHGLYITPGFHLGEFADFPLGFYPGLPIPADFGTLEPQKRWSWRFAFAITHRVKNFESRKSAPVPPAPAPGVGGGTPGTPGTPPVSPVKPTPPQE